MGQTYGRDANSTDTGFASDWSPNGGASAPPPGGANSAGYFAPQVFVQVDPAWVPMMVDPGGGQILFYVKIGNEFPFVQNLDVWTNIILPSGTIYGPLILRENRNFQPQDSLTVSVSQNVPGAAPAGVYRYNVYIGDYPSSWADVSYFYFEKLGLDAAGADIWEEPTGWDLPGESEPAAQGAAAAPRLEASPNPFNTATTLAIVRQAIRRLG